MSTNDDLELAAWRTAAVALAELTLEEIPWNDPDRRGLTSFLSELRNDAALIDQYSQWRRRFPKLAAGMVHARLRAAERACRLAGGREGV